MKYFTSDTHFAHSFVAALRGFIRPEYQEHSANDLRNMVRYPSSDLMWEQCVNTEEHDVLVLANINEVVTETDELYILGDLSAGGKRSFESALGRLQQLNVPRRRRHLVLGNHDDLGRGKERGETLLGVFGDFTAMGATTIVGRHNVILSPFQFQHHFAEQYDGLAAMLARGSTLKTLRWMTGVRALFAQTSRTLPSQTSNGYSRSARPYRTNHSHVCYTVSSGKVRP